MVQVEHDKLFERLRNSYLTGLTKSCWWRIAQLKRLERMLLENHDEITRALTDDLGRSSFECLYDTHPVIAEIQEAILNIRYTHHPLEYFFA